MKTELFETISSLKKGNQITFSGEFIVRNGCIIERSLSQSGSMNEPELIFRFSKITRSAATTQPTAQQPRSLEDIGRDAAKHMQQSEQRQQSKPATTADEPVPPPLPQ